MNIVDLSFNELAYLFSFIPKAPYLAIVCNKFHAIVNSELFLSLWKEKHVIQFLDSEIVWLGAHSDLMILREDCKGKIFDRETICYKLEKLFVPYSGIIYNSYEHKYYDDINVYDRGSIVRKYYDDVDNAIFYDNIYKECDIYIKETLTVKHLVYGWKKEKFYPEHKGFVAYPIVKHHDFGDLSKLHDILKQDTYLKTKVRINWTKDGEYTIRLNDGRKMYKILNGKYYKVKRKRVGKKVKCINEDGNIVYRSRMQEIKEILYPIKKENIPFDIPFSLFERCDPRIAELFEKNRSEIAMLIPDYHIDY